MGRLRHHHRKRFGRHGRVHLAVLLTIVVVTWLLVPWIVSLLDAGRGYSPAHYEPRDGPREEHLLRHPLPPVAFAPGKAVLNAALVFLVVLAWLSVFSPGARRR